MPIDMVQELSVEVDSRTLLEQYLQFTIPTVLSSNEEVIVKVVDRGERLTVPGSIDLEKEFAVILISGWYRKPGDKSYFSESYQPCYTFQSSDRMTSVDAAVQQIRTLFDDHGTAWRNAFWQKFGDGYNSCFLPSDGSTDIGYKLRSCSSFPEWLAISLVHIYYGK